MNPNNVPPLHLQGDDLKQQMRAQWNARANDDAEYWTMNCVPRGEWNLTDYYASGVPTVERYVLPFFREWFDPAAQRLLEIGCGVGRITFPLAAHFREVVGVDVSDEMVSKAKKRNTKTRNPARNISFLAIAGTGLEDFDAESFDAVVSVACLQHIPNPDIQLHYLDEIGRVLRPGGAFLVHLYTDLTNYARLAHDWAVREIANDPLGWDDLAKEELPRWRTSISNALVPDNARQHLVKAGLAITHDVGEYTHLHWIGGHKEPV